MHPGQIIVYGTGLTVGQMCRRNKEETEREEIAGIKPAMFQTT